MLHILFVILKIIGIVLAAAAGILLLALIFALFVPVRYCVLADGKLGEEEPVHVEIKVTWLLHIINAVFSYSKTARLKVRVFCFPLFDTSKKKSGKENAKRKDAGKKNDGIQNPAAEDENKNHPDAEENPPVTEEAEEGRRAVQEGEEPGNDTGKEKKGGGIRAFFETVQRFFRKLLEAVENIEYTIRKIYGKIKNIMENIRYYTNIMKGEAFRHVLGNVKKQLFWILRKVGPKKCRIDLTAGTGDPASTGQIMAVYGMLYPFIGKHVSIQADFENKRIEGDLYIKGKVVAIVFLIAAIKLLIDKNIWKLFKLLKKEDA